MAPIRFETHPSEYKHWQLDVDGPVAKLTMAVDAEHPLRPGYELKLNSYDLSVDIELADAVQRIRFEHPEVRTVVISADLDRVFCSGANIYMLGASDHSFKVNFCKYTNETRLYMEEASRNSGLRFLAACKGTTAGGGYELALACDHITLVDDGSSAVSFPETPLLGVLPGTGGLTRLVDKRKVRRDRADVFCTLAEGIKGRRAVEWGLVDQLLPRSKFDEGVRARAEELAKEVAEVAHGPAVSLPPLAPSIEDDLISYRHVSVEFERSQRTATLTLRAPAEAPPTSIEDSAAQGADLWSLRLFRELDHALCHLRFNEPEIGLVLVRSVGDPAQVLAADAALDALQEHGFTREVRLFQARVLRRLDTTARSFFAVIDSDSNCFAGSLLEVALAADRVYMLEDDDEEVGVHTSVANSGIMPMANGLSRLAVRFYGDADQVDEVLGRGKDGLIPTADAEELGLATIAADDIDFEDELRIACEERASLSPDALTGMEASLRFPGPETLETKIFGRLSAWQNWIFTRPNATGERGALTLYGQPERPSFRWART
ncbi:2,3-epoxybenzoyl-CoA dihydrolase [Haliangium ochraceum]|uniref:Benzoyl-CoA-dihydrodiol lyase n=1 Tax=Haliangium ochraceum (strain DSM 14365 / JCM 11303 / SMP-2) TaxID=502025 RepID=D0LXF4_HALO1|nr:2,3-epoxybenzoyl-CoA dihydrolase [Haliangium ochraceum]ACY17709.1 benzoyl-CoA-dihydrodiol lyase [Haliangium ochraceum DSM 14365]